MKALRRRLLCVLLGYLVIGAVGTPPQAAPVDERPPPPVDDFLRERVTPPTQAKSLDEYLIDVALAANLNIIADATEFPAAPPVHPYPGTAAAWDGVNKGKTGWAPTRLNVISDVANQHRLSLLRPQRNLFLIWKEPEIIGLGSLIAAAKSQEESRLTGNDSDDARDAANLKELLIAHGWDGKSRNQVIKLSPEELPITLQVRLRKEIRAWLASRAGPINQDLWFDENFWAGSRLTVKYELNDIGTNKIPYLYVFGVAGNNGKKSSAVIGEITTVLPAAKPRSLGDLLKR